LLFELQSLDLRDIELDFVVVPELVIAEREVDVENNSKRHRYVGESPGRNVGFLIRIYGKISPLLPPIRGIDPPS